MTQNEPNGCRCHEAVQRLPFRFRWPVLEIAGYHSINPKTAISSEYGIVYLRINADIDHFSNKPLFVYLRINTNIYGNTDPDF
jgi:hypothetical protein